MTSQISGPCCNSDIKPDQYKSLYGKVMLANKFLPSLKIFIVKRNKIQLGFDNIYSILKIIMVCKGNIKHGKNCADEWLFFLCSVISVCEIMLWHFTKKFMERKASKLKGFNRHQRPTKRVGYIAQRSRLLFPPKKKQLVWIMSCTKKIVCLHRNVCNLV